MSYAAVYTFPYLLYMSEKRLTIAIPTFNRPEELDRALAALIPQVREFSEYINIIVSDNASDFDIKGIVDKYIVRDIDLVYHRHVENLGMDGNFSFLYNQCQTKYFWMLSDDDLVLPNGLGKIMQLINGEDFGILYLNNYWFSGEVKWQEIKSLPMRDGIVKFDQPLQWLEKVNYWITFISGNLINKDLVYNKVDFSNFKNTFLSQLAWTIPAIFAGVPNFIIEDHVLLCKANNTGGYKLVEVFGRNLNYIMDLFINRGVDKSIKRIVNNNLLISFFPLFLSSENRKFGKEKYLFAMLSVFWSYKAFWKLHFRPLLKQQLNLG